MRKGVGSTVEDNWETDILSRFTSGANPISVINSFYVEFKGGRMSGYNTMIINNTQKTVVPFSGKYTIEGDTMEITESNACTTLLNDGTKKIVIIDGVIRTKTHQSYIVFFLGATI